MAKSMLALALAIAIAGGARRFLGRAVRNTPVLFVDFELDGGEQRRRACHLARGAGLEEPPEDLYYLSALGRVPRRRRSMPPSKNAGGSELVSAS